MAELAEALGFGGQRADAVLRELEAFYADVDARIEKSTRDLGLPCAPGCDACCHEAVFVSAPEFFRVVAECVLKRTPEEMNALVDDMVRIADAFDDELSMLETFTPGPERDEVAARVRFRCPLLGANGKCSVYPGRELNARTFGATRLTERGHIFGCSLTHARMQALGPTAESSLIDAHTFRRELSARIPEAQDVHVYPWWFRKFQHCLRFGPTR